MSVNSLLAKLVKTTEPTDCGTTGVKAFAWARLSTEEQDERGASLEQQFREIEHYAQQNSIEIIDRYQEIGSAYQHEERRVEFARMIEDAKRTPEVTAIIVHDLSRFSRDSIVAQTRKRELEQSGITVLSVTDPSIDRTNAGSVYLEHMILAKNEAYSLDVAFHTRKGCKANVQSRNPETGWCYKNGGQPLFGYKSVRLTLGEDRRGRPIFKSIWEFDDTVINGRPVHEWARECLLLAMQGASLQQLCDYCEENGIPGRRKAHWGTTTWNALLAPAVLMKYCGHEVYGVHGKKGKERPTDEWVIVEKAHPALISGEEAESIASARMASNERRLDRHNPNRGESRYLLSGGLFVCNRCGSNMVGYQNGRQFYYKCGSHLYRKGRGCGPGVAVRQDEVETYVTDGLLDLLGRFADAKGFTKLVNDQLQAIWQRETGYDPLAARKLEALKRKINNARNAILESMDEEERAWNREQLNQFKAERDGIEASVNVVFDAPVLNANEAKRELQDVEDILEFGTVMAKKQVVRRWVNRITLDPEELSVHVDYQICDNLLSNTDPGLLTEVCGDRSGSGGGI